MTAANSPAKAADAAVLAALDERLADRPARRRPLRLGVVTKVDRLPPPLVGPPYSLEPPSTAKEQAIAGAVEYARESLPGLVDAVPVVAEAGRLWNIDAGLLPRLLTGLDDARQIALLRGFEQARQPERFRTTLAKAGSAVGQLTRAWLRSREATRSADEVAPSSASQ